MKGVDSEAPRERWRGNRPDLNRAIVWFFLREAAWLAALAVAGVAFILVDLTVGFPAILEFITGRPM